jgi:PAS domain S-box-containing protein
MEKMDVKALWEKVVETADSIIVVLDPGGKIKLFNQKAEKMTGYQAKEVLGKSWLDIFVPSAYRPNIRKTLDALREERGVPRYGKYPILSKDRRELPIAWNRIFIKDSRGKTEAILSIGHDLTLSQIIEEERYYTQTVMDSITDGVLAVDRDLKITSFNRAATKITGFSKEEALGQYCREILRSSLCAVQCPMKELMETGSESPNLEADILSKQNKEIPVSLSPFLRKDQNGHLSGGILIFRDLTSIAELKKELQEKYSFQDIISKNKTLLELFGILPDIAASDATVLITGESGTGKELVAKALHQLSSRSERPFIEVNCGALPETLLESELFGYKRGAFTDAKQDKPGRFKLAEGGTLFLDEIGDISLGIQSKLLRVLEAKEYEPLGGTRTEKADVRVVSATNKNLWSQVQSGEFREDLYYRLNLFPIEIPPLRDRPEDIPLLIDHFLTRFNHTKGRNIAGLTRSAMEALLNHAYPGNVRELQNIIEHAFILCKTTHIGPDCLPAYLRKKDLHKNTGRGKKALDEFERDLIVETLQKHGGKLQETADEMGIHRATLWRKMKKMKIA